MHGAPKFSKNMKITKQSRTGIGIMVVAAIVLESIVCFQYFTSRAAIKREAVQRAESELRKAELEINVVTVEMEAAAKMLTTLAQIYIDNPDSIARATRVLLQTLDNVSSAGVACTPDYFPQKGHWYEVCSSREGDSIYTRQIGSANHDYFQMEWYKNGLVMDSCWWSEPYLDDSGARTMVVSCSHPIRDRQGNIVAVTCVDLSLERLQQISEYLQIFKESYYSISSSNGLDIVPAPDTIPGRKYYTFHEEIDATGWHIEIIIPDKVLFGDLRRTGLITTIMMIIGLVVLALMLIHSRNLTKKLIAFTEKNQRMESELEVAQTIQMAMLPKVFPPFLDRLDLNIYGFVNPAKEIGGDLYDFYVRHDKLFFCIGDVSGKGIPAALVMATARSSFRNVSAHEEDAATIVNKMNDALTEQNDQNMFITLFLGVLDLKTGVLNYCNAGHNAPVHLLFNAPQFTPEEMSVLANLPLGVMKDFEYRAETTQMHYDEMLFLYTDGLTEAENAVYEQFGEKRMLQSLSKFNTCRPREIVETMQANVEAFVAGAQQSDDLTMLAIRYQRPAILMRNDIQQIPTLSEWVEGLNVPNELNMPINLALEEAVSNVMLYAYPEKSGQVFVEFVRVQDNQGGRIIFTISDNGIPFDPTQKAPADITLSAEERAIGGLGIHLVRQLMDEVSYRREDGKNILTLIKCL